jgi:hypothetical protein
LALNVKPKEMEEIAHGNCITKMEQISDIEQGVDQEAQINVFGWNYLSGASISWKSMASNSVTLSSTEGE